MIDGLSIQDIWEIANEGFPWWQNRMHLVVQSLHSHKFYEVYGSTRGKYAYARTPHQTIPHRSQGVELYYTTKKYRLHCNRQQMDLFVKKEMWRQTYFGLRCEIPGYVISPNNDLFSWNSGIIPKVIEAIHQEFSFKNLPILADLLEEYGMPQSLLDHLHTDHSNFHGCWAVDGLFAELNFIPFTPHGPEKK